MYDSLTFEDIVPAQRCPECHQHSKTFKTPTDFFWHVDSCVQHAIESEVLNTFGDFHDESAPRMTQTIPGLVAKVATPSTMRPFVHRSESDLIASQPRQMVPITTEQLTQTLKGPGGIELLVSVERTEDMEIIDSGHQPLTVVDVTTEPPLPQSSRDEYYDEEPTSTLENDFEDFDDIDDDVLDDVETEEKTETDDTTLRLKMDCPTCGLRLYRHNFATHNRIHTGEQPYACQYCRKKFRNSSARRVHERAHTGEKPYACKTCTYASTTKRNLDRHVINNHGVLEDGSIDTRPSRSRRSVYRDATALRKMVPSGFNEQDWERIAKKARLEIQTEQSPSSRGIENDHKYIQQSHQLASRK